MRFLSQEIRPLMDRQDLLELVLLDSEGMVLDAEGSLFPPEQLAALFSPLHRLLAEVKRGLNIQAVEEISVRTLGPRMRVILQDFSVNEATYLLIALFPITTFYRQVTTDIIRIVKECVRRLAPASPERPSPDQDVPGRGEG